MTIREKLEKLQDEFKKRTDEHLEATNDLVREGNGFFDKILLDNFVRTKMEWQKAEATYHSYLADIVNKKINVEAEE